MYAPLSDRLDALLTNMIWGSETASISLIYYLFDDTEPIGEGEQVGFCQIRLTAGENFASIIESVTQSE